MISCLLYRPPTPNQSSRYYRVEIVMNLFEEISVLREWGVRGGKGTHRIDLYGNLRHASEKADQWRQTALGRGYSLFAFD